MRTQPARFARIDLVCLGTSAADPSRPLASVIDSCQRAAMIKPLGCELATCPLCKSLAAEVAYRAALVAEVARLRKGIEHALDQYAGGYPHGDTLRSLLVPHDVP